MYPNADTICSIHRKIVPAEMCDGDVGHLRRRDGEERGEREREIEGGREREEEREEEKREEKEKREGKRERERKWRGRTAGMNRPLPSGSRFLLSFTVFRCFDRSPCLQNSMTVHTSSSYRPMSKLQTAHTHTSSDVFQTNAYTLP